MSPADVNFTSLLRVAFDGKRNIVEKRFDRLELAEKVSLLNWVNVSTKEQFIEYLFNRAKDLAR